MITWHDVWVVVAATAGVAVVGAGAGAGALMALRGRSMRLLLAVVALTVVTVMAVAVAAVGALMLVSGHALVVLVASVTAAALAGLAVAALLGREVRRGSTSLREQVRSLGSDRDAGSPQVRASTVTGAELAGLGEELERVRQQLTDARRRAAALEGSRRELVSWVSHDLRTPLADVRAMAEALEDGVVSDAGTVRDYHRGIRVESERLTRMVDDLFELSRIQAGSLGLAPDLVDLGALVAAEAEPAGELARRRHLALRVECSEPVRVVADAHHLGRAVRNLVANAVRHTAEGGEVVVSVRRGPGGGGEVSVRDGCGGIPAADLDRVFEVGFRGQGAGGQEARTPGPDHGAGLGLAIAAGIAAAHDGELQVVNEPPGCRFTLRLPDAAVTGTVVTGSEAPSMPVRSWGA